MKPLILDYAVDRSEIGEIAFSYDDTLNLNVIKNNQKVIPYVDADTDSLALETVTKVKNEGSDYSLDLATETRVSREGNDMSFDFLELKTKTFVKRERDDE